MSATIYTGARFGMLTVLSKGANNTEKRGRPSRILCQCDCGRFVAAHSPNLYSGKTRSCGCQQERYTKKPENLPTVAETLVAATAKMAVPA